MSDGGADSPRRFLLDTMLGKLATYLRMCGYDAAYTLDEGIEDDDEILDRLHSSGRTLLTRSHALADRAPAVVLLQSRDIEDQLRELAAAGLDLSLAEKPARCGVCNAPVERVGIDERTPEYAPDPSDVDVWRCVDCGQHFWQGSHWDDVAETLAALSDRPS
ncbi:Mut7-C RNAse domain-containing protein [Salinibaculum rarum]|uniref:Mut7-C RNAse domain-containing protein n=1 Tax=Salinibaculum rarum TaxID=3058903 RepID=UPI00265FB2B9|nr:Mut7-C RNAse domain-containing protein [Salinibaculum sp. KK48]